MDVQPHNVSSLRQPHLGEHRIDGGLGAGWPRSRRHGRTVLLVRTGSVHISQMKRLRIRISFCVWTLKFIRIHAQPIGLFTYGDTLTQIRTPWKLKQQGS